MKQNETLITHMIISALLIPWYLFNFFFIPRRKYFIYPFLIHIFEFKVTENFHLHASKIQKNEQETNK